MLIEIYFQQIQNLIESQKNDNINITEKRSLVPKVRTSQSNKTDNLDGIKLVNNQSMAKTITATFDGEYLRPDNPVDLQRNQSYLIIVGII